MARYDEEDAMSNYKAPESSSETNLRANAAAKGNALAKESYSEQRLRKGAKPMVKAKPKVKPVVTKVVAAKSADAARARYAGPAVGDRGMDARIAAKKAAASASNRSKSPAGMKSRTTQTTTTSAKKKNVGSRFADALTGGNKPKLSTAAKAAEQAKLKKAYDIAKAKKKGM